MIRQLAGFPLMLQESAKALEPHRITGYLQELAGIFHRYYHDHRILPGKNEETQKAEARDSDHSLELAQTRLALIDSIQVVLKKGLNILGISSPDTM